MRYLRGDEVWAIELAGTSITIVDATGTRVEESATPLDAKTRHRVLVSQKLRDGWKVEKLVVEAPARVIPAAPVVFDAREPAIEATILADPDADELYRIYGDWLQQQGDPRGELIALYAKARAEPGNRKVADAVRRRFERYRDYLAGGVPRDAVSFAWGFIAEIMIWDCDARVLARALALPSARFVRRILISDNDEERGSALADAIKLVAERAPPTLRHLELRGLAALHELHTVASRLPALRSLAVTAPIAPRATCFDTLVRSPLPTLESLELVLDADELAAARPLLQRPDLPALESLWIYNAFDQNLRDLLATAPIAAQLRTLVLPEVRQSDLSTLLPWLDAFPKLEAIGVPLIAWSDAAQQAVRKRFSIVWDGGDLYPDEAQVPTLPGARCGSRLRRARD